MELKKSQKADLEWRKPVFFQIGVFIALGLVLTTFELFRSKDATAVNVGNSGANITEDVILQTQQQKPPIAPPPAAPITSTEIKVIDDNIKIETDYEVDAESDESTKTQEFEQVEYVEEETKEAEIFVVVEENPEFPGGDEARQMFFKNNIVYPKVAKEASVEGKVIVSFVVEPDGSITNAKIERGKIQALDDEALRVTKMMPKWNPGKQRGKSVRCRFTMPVSFVLQ
jgi:periplasmic protein TonB